MSTQQKPKLILRVLGLASFILFVPLLWGHLYGCNKLWRRLFPTVIAQEYVPDSSVEFNRLSSADGVGPKGAAFETFEFRSTDCINVDSSYLRFGIENDAKEVMIQQINSAQRVITPTSQIASPDGNRQGERTVIFIRGEYVILRKLGVKLHSISSSSLNHALEFERRAGFELEKQDSY